MLKKIVDLVEGFPVYYSRPYGSYVLDRQGQKIGYWYSSLQTVGVKVNHESRTVSIQTETPWLWDEDDRLFHRGGGIGIRF
jgi:peptidoglycan/xylan/chitin deacetylase (PgdA/CDA1 family)